MNTIYLERLFLNQKKCIAIKFSDTRNPFLYDICYKINGSKWSADHKCWYIENNNNSMLKIERAFDGKAHINDQRLYSGKDGIGDIVKFKQAGPADNNNTEPTDRSDIHQFIFYLRDRRYSERTINTYVKGIRVFLNYYHNKTPNEITNSDIIDFNNRYIIARKLSASFQNQIINAIKLYYQTVHNKQLDPDLIKRPKRPKKLPNVLSMDEVAALLNSIRNLKHRTMLALIYGCGLRRSEMLEIKLSDVDSSRMMLLIRNGKGMKDRMVPLSQSNLSMLREYYQSFQPKTYLFEGQQGGRYSERSLTSVFQQALQRTNIRKPATLHWLRHSYATHLLENGTDVRIIQELLGHKSTKTTMIYTHVSQATIHKIKSPIDRLDLSGKSNSFL